MENKKFIHSKMWLWATAWIKEI